MSFDLDDEQQAVVGVTRSARQVVIAGPGAGKTQVVSRLVENLVAEEGVDPVRGLIVLSFSNAAVAAVSARLRNRDVPPVQVRTIDSLASGILRQHDGGDDVTAMSFDTRIQKATALLRDEEWEEVEDLEHLVVDEVQDVVGVRADFVLALTRALPEDAGMTLLGDPAQAIYDFQLAPAAGPALSVTTSAQLLDEVRASGARTVVLRGQYRARGRDALAASSLRGEGLEVADAMDVEDFWNDVVHVGGIEDAWRLVRGRSGTRAFLTATNGQALLVAAELRALGARVQVQRGSRQQVLAPWIARVFQECPGASISRGDFEDTLQLVGPGIDPAPAWRALRSVASARSRDLDRVALASGLRARAYVPAELRESGEVDAVVSTIHRAKGLEFDDVALVEFKSGRGLEADDTARSRNHFVALTRARDLLLRLEGPIDRSVWRPVPRPPASPRWIQAGNQAWQTFGFEIRSGDIDPDSLIGSSDEAQELLAGTAVVGSAARLEPCSHLSTLALPVFRVLVNGIEVGATHPSFGVDLVGRVGTLEKKRRGWPALSGLPIESIATVVDERLGFRLAPVLSGLANIEWSSGDD